MLIAESWRRELSDKRFRNSFLISTLVLGIILFTLTKFLTYVEAREGVILNDPILNFYKPVDLTWIIFAVIYLSLITAIFSLLPSPKEFLHAIQLYVLMVFFRIIAMFLLPLNPPDGMIMLKDPFVEYFGTGETLTKDLFFSGHTATIFIFFLTAGSKMYKGIFLTLTGLIAILVLLQKVHYTIDVYAAFFFTTACYFILKKLKESFNF